MQSWLFTPWGKEIDTMRYWQSRGAARKKQRNGKGGRGTKEVGVFTFRGRKVYKRLRVVFRSEEVDVVEVGLFFYRFSLI